MSRKASVPKLPRAFELEALGQVMMEARTTLQDVAKFAPNIAERLAADDVHARTLCLMLAKQADAVLAKMVYHEAEL